MSRLNEEGIIIDDVIVFRIQDETFWVSTLFIDELITWFDAHKAGEQVTYREITDITAMYAVQGSDSRKVLNAFSAKNTISSLWICQTILPRRHMGDSELDYFLFHGILIKEKSESKAFYCEASGKICRQHILSDCCADVNPNEKPD